MASALSPTPEASLNQQSSPSSAKRSREEYEANVYTIIAENNSPNSSGGISSPFLSRVNDTDTMDCERISPSKAKHARVLSGNKPSPLKILSTAHFSSPDVAINDENAPPMGHTSPRKMSPEKRFPVKITDPTETPRPQQPSTLQTRTEQKTINVEQAIQTNPGLARAIEIFEDEGSMMEDVGNVSDITASGEPPALGVEEPALDDTMVSTFSTFSAVPDMLARLGHSPAKLPVNGGRNRLDAGARHSSSSRESNDSTNLLDFTEQFRLPPKPTQPRGSLSPNRTSRASMSPMRNYTNLIDFDLPPMPTPRSVPTISARELESLKSGFMSEISSLKASLSGKEAEVNSLKTAVGDAEKRVGESMEQLREERGMKEQLAAEKESWEVHSREVENVLQKIKEDIEQGQSERDELEQKLEESEKKREAAEMMHQEAESKIAGMRAGKELDKPSSPEKVQSANSSKEVEIAVERVARELHVLYKNKHETKVAALKKSYESRWEKKIRELEGKINELNEDNEKLRQGRDTTLTQVDPANIEAEVKEWKTKAVKDSAAIKELHADVERLEAVVQTVQRDNEGLRTMLERERVEKGELVQLAEEMMSMQSFVAQTPKPQMPRPEQQQQQHKQAPQQQENTSHAQYQSGRTPGPKASVVHDTARTPGTARSSGLRAPGTGMRGGHERGRSGGGAVGASVRSGAGARSGILSSIEKMGNYRGRAGE